jgi:enterochelin esterase-like enzyme
MGLTSGSLLIVMVAAAICWIALTVVLWPRLVRRRRSRARTQDGIGRFAARLAGRVALLIGSQALVLAAFLVWLNSYFSFYDSWSELLGNSAPVVAVAPKPTPPDLHILGKLPPAGRPLRQLPSPVVFYGFGLGPGPGVGGLAPHPSGHTGHRLIRLPGAAVYGEIARVQIKGLRTGLAADTAYIYLPPQYFRRAYAHQRFPVVETLTGYPGGARSIIERLGLPETSEKLVAEQHARPAIYVMMNVSPVFPRDTECTNVPAGPQVLTFFAVDVPLAIERTFRVATSRAGWGTLGYSTGGLCAAKLAMIYPYTFSAAVSIAGYYYADRDDTTGNLYGSSQAYRNENDLFWRLMHLPIPPISILVTSSKIGESTYPGTLRFLRLIRPPMRGYSLILPVGGHNFGVWREELPQTLEWLTTRLGSEGSVSGTSSPGSHQAGAMA